MFIAVSLPKGIFYYLRHTVMKDKLVKFTPVTLTMETIDHITREGGSDALALYVSYVGISQWQKTTRVRATETFMMNRLNWGRDKFRKAKRFLLDNNFIENVNSKSDTGTIKGWYVEINYLVHPTEIPTGGQDKRVANKPPSALEKKESALEKKESACENKFSREIAEVIEIFKKELSPSISYGNKAQRNAVTQMFTLYGVEQVLELAQRAVEVQGRPYAPTITTPHQLWTKHGQLRVYLKREQDSPKNPVMKSVKI